MHCLHWIDWILHHWKSVMCILSCCKERFEQICKQNDTINTHLIDRSISLLYLDIIPSKLVTTVLIFQSFSCSATRLTCSHHCSDTILTTKLTGSTVCFELLLSGKIAERGVQNSTHMGWTLPHSKLISHHSVAIPRPAPLKLYPPWLGEFWELRQSSR